MFLVKLQTIYRQSIKMFDKLVFRGSIDVFGNSLQFDTNRYYLGEKCNPWMIGKQMLFVCLLNAFIFNAFINCYLASENNCLRIYTLTVNKLFILLFIWNISFLLFS